MFYVSVTKTFTSSSLCCYVSLQNLKIQVTAKLWAADTQNNVTKASLTQ